MFKFYKCLNVENVIISLIRKIKLFLQIFLVIIFNNDKTINENLLFKIVPRIVIRNVV